MGKDTLEVDKMMDTWDIRDESTYPNLGDYDIIYNCSGITLNEPVISNNFVDMQKVMDVNITGAMLLTAKYAQDRQPTGKGGVIIHIGSTGSRTVFTNCSAYCASKAALAHYVKCAGYELKSKGICVIGVHPGNIAGTQMTSNVQMGLTQKRGMSQEQVDKIYAEAHDPVDIATFCVNLMAMPLFDMTGENIYLGNGHKG
jgi:NAD(P)-dependent dehydrogenase (short-subunit alcohol dehydrogenase family)